MKNQIELCKRLNFSDERVALMESIAQDLLDGDSSNREGHLAKVYFNTLFGMGFTRDLQNIENACLNCGYSILRSHMARCVVACGLNPVIGVHHCNEYNSFNLVDDLLEPFRPIIDDFILEKILDGSEMLTYEKRLKIIDSFNRKMIIGKKAFYFNQVMIEYVNSFIKAIEKNDPKLLLSIRLSNVCECDESEI